METDPFSANLCQYWIFCYNEWRYKELWLYNRYNNESLIQNKQNKSCDNKIIQTKCLCSWKVQTKKYWQKKVLAAKFEQAKQARNCFDDFLA